MQYAGFLHRFGAMWIDLLILSPVIFLSVYFSGQYRLFHLYWLAPGVLIGLWFHVYLVVRHGGTPGKLLLNIRIAMTDGGSPTVKAAFLRHVVLLVLSLLSSIGLILATLQMSDTQYQSLGFVQRTEAMTSLAPRWYHAAALLTNIWVWSEFLTMLLNKKRRAIHDFIAGTVVIRKTAA